MRPPPPALLEEESCSYSCISVIDQYTNNDAGFYVGLEVGPTTYFGLLCMIGICFYDAAGAVVGCWQSPNFAPGQLWALSVELLMLEAVLEGPRARGRPGSGHTSPVNHFRNCHGLPI